VKRVAWIAAVTLALDQATKLAIEFWLPLGDTRYVIRGLFNLVHVGNTGAAWSILQGNNWLLAIISIATLGILFWFRRSFPLDRPMARCSLGLITGGIIGNLIDRLRVGHVIDFLDFYWGGWHWPAFNVADSAICIGVFLYIIATWRDHPPSHDPSSGSTPDRA
jgi:signal peptidase II